VQAGLGGSAEQRVGRDRRVERGERHDAVKLRLGVARSDVVEIAAGIAAVGHGDVAAQQDRGDEPAAQLPVGVDLVGDQAAEDEGALRMTDQDHAAAVVVFLRYVFQARSALL
jgi:hypothetical protein